MALDLYLFGDKLRRYREQLQLSLGEVSHATGIGEEALAAFEKGARAPTGDEVLILADFYKCDYKFFLSNEKLMAFEQTDTLFRRFGTAFSRQDRWAVLEVLFLADVESYLQHTLGKTPPRAFTFQKTGGYFKGHGEQAAAALRAFLGYADHQVPLDIYRDFRTIGMHVFRRRLDNSTISGVYVKHPVAGPCLLINYSEDVYRQRFTAAHEAAHAILDQEEDVIVSFTQASHDLPEVRANTFASHYLMPPAFLQRIPDPRQWDGEKAVHWANALKVSTEALAIALSQAGLIDRRTEEAIKAVRVPREAKEDPELPTSLSPRSRARKEELLTRGLADYYVNLCFEAYREGMVSAARVAEMLLLDGDAELRDLAALYGEALRYGD
jgi:Zn-dependent peptidase ImmA (M78 family)